MTITFAIMPLSRLIAGDFSMPFEVSGEPKLGGQVMSWGPAAAASRRRKDLYDVLDGWLPNLPGWQAWDEKSAEGPLFHSVSSKAFKGVTKALRVKRWPHAVATVFVPYDLAEPFDMRVPLQQRTGSAIVALHELEGSKSEAAEVFRAALRQVIELNLPMVLLETPDPVVVAEVVAHTMVIPREVQARVGAVWGRIEAWLAAHAPRIVGQLAPPASLGQIAAAEHVMDVRLPDEVRALYAIHDGQPGIGAGIFDRFQWSTLAEVVSSWKVWNDLLEKDTFEALTSEPGPGIRSEWWHPAWIPIAHDGSGDSYCVDMAPAEGGTAGQVLYLLHETGERPLISSSVGAWLERLANELESGFRTYDEEAGALLTDDER